ncbi:MAG: WD40/YVTN/BNR-like repeat-containing protein [Candidatus Limnocylindrales bacterium]
MSSIRFADPLDGWSFGSSLWATHDGGATWHPTSVPGLPADSVMGLEASGGTVTALVADTAGAIRLATSPVATDAWHVTGPAVSLGAGPVPRPNLVLSRSAGWLLEVDRTVIAPGARLVGGTWRTWQPPCATANGPALLAAADASNLVAACDAGVWGPPSGGLPMGAHLYLARDGGLTFTLVAGTLPLGYPSWIAMPTATTIAIAGTRTSGSAIAISADSGRTWRVAAVGSATEAIIYLGFTTATQGVAIATDQAGGGRLLMTRDGGRSWSPVAF